MKVLILDNYDSFTYNLYDYTASFGANVVVKRNDEIGLDAIESFSHIVLSPGPGLPKNAGIMPELIAKYVGSKKILGVCLGMQAIGEYFGANLYNLSQPKHGVEVICKKEKDSLLLRDVPDDFSVGLYHSWGVQNVVEPLEIFCKSIDDVIMGFQHKILPIYGVQFHPESILTPTGKKMLQNFLDC